jgi:hypothetical protein
MSPMFAMRRFVYTPYALGLGMDAGIATISPLVAPSKPGARGVGQVSRLNSCPCVIRALWTRHPRAAKAWSRLTALRYRRIRAEIIPIR